MTCRQKAYNFKGKIKPTETIATWKSGLELQVYKQERKQNKAIGEVSIRQWLVNYIQVQHSYWYVSHFKTTYQKYGYSNSSTI